jgi:C1A family cysteine protease
LLQSSGGSGGISIDWVAAGKVTAVKNQGGSCASGWAFSATAAVESAQIIFKNTTYNLSEQQLIDCSGVLGNMGCLGGYVSIAFSFMMLKGTTSTSYYPYVGTTGYCRAVLNLFKLSSYQSVNPTCTSLTTALTSQPISVNIDATNWAPYTTGVFDDCGCNLNHAALLVGQTDTYWTIKNSWGTLWGESGFIQLAAGNTCGVCNSPWYPIL